MTKLTLLQKMILCLVISSMISACKKDISEEETIVKIPVTENTEIIDSVDIQSINFKTSTSRLTFATIAQGYALPGGGYNTLSLTNVGFTHPSVIYFKDGWNNHKYWMANTPYPAAMSQYENPTIFCSDDGYNWKEPAGILNPIEKAPEKPGYNSDVNLFYDNGKLYCFWRAITVFEPSIGRIPGRALYYKTSEDGINWSERRYITGWDYYGVDLISPAVLKQANEYYCYGVSTGEKVPGSYFTNYGIRRMVHYNIHDFKVDKTKGYDLINIATRPWGPDDEPWHIEARKHKNLWFILVATSKNNEYGRDGKLYLGYSKDGINFTFTNKPICDANYVYKSSFYLFEDKDTKTLNIKLWRATSTDWSIYYDQFSLKEYFAKPNS